MNRRQFLERSAFFTLSLTLSSLFSHAEAGVLPRAVERGGLYIKETDLKFVELEKREKTDAIVVHHVGNTNRDVSAREIHQWHKDNGWAGIGYHYVIRKNGIIERGRPRDMVGAHCYGQNDHTLGINVVGNFEEALPTLSQVKSLVRLTTQLCKIYGLVPSGETIVGHRDFVGTACPGENLYEMLPKIVGGVERFYARA